MEIKELQREIYKNNVAKGFYEVPVETATRLMLTVSELSEALEADRKNKYFDSETNKDVLQQTEGEEFKEYFEDLCKNTFEDELSDAVIRILDMAQH